MPRSVFTFLFLSCLSLSGCAGQRLAQYGPSCRVEKVAELPLTVQRNFLLAPVTVDGDDELFVVDTGAEATLLTPDAVARLGLQQDPKHSSILLGVAGAIRSANVIARKVSVGDIVQRDKSMGVGSIGLFGGTGRPVSGLLGTDLLSRYDVEIDGPGRRIGFYDVHDCTGYVPWEGRSVVLPATPTRRGLLFVPVAIDGRPVRALLDTGARASLVTRRVAYALGVDDRMLDADPHRTGQGVGNGGIDFRMHRFASVDIGNIPMRDMPLNVADMRLPGVEMLLGADWISTRRLWISYGAGVVFVHATTL
jgi:predicted aspartyl protease